MLYGDTYESGDEESNEYNFEYDEEEDRYFRVSTHVHENFSKDIIEKKESLSNKYVEGLFIGHEKPMLNILSKTKKPEITTKTMEDGELKYLINLVALENVRKSFVKTASDAKKKPNVKHEKIVKIK